MLSLGGLRNWVEYGIRNYGHHPERQEDCFALRLADSRAIVQRERHGTLSADVERQLDLYLRALWRDADQLVPYSTAFDDLRKPVPYYDKLGLRIPDVYDDARGVAGIDRYRATLAHMVGHRRWSTPRIADNLSPFQRMAVEFLEDARIDVADPGHLKADAKKAVEELDAQGVATFCLSLDPKADEYVREIFGHRWRVLDRIERLPEQLPMLYLALTR